MINLVIILWVICAILLLLRYAPGFKCMGYCKIKGFKRKRALDKISDIALECLYERKTVAEAIKNIPTKKLKKIHLDSSIFSCHCIDKLGEEELRIRKEIINIIAERDLLDA